MNSGVIGLRPTRSTTVLRAKGFRAEIGALRAVAVVLVVMFHVWPDIIPGGFVGVDIFFSVSGFLIGGHLLRELAETGSIRLGRFWLRRAARLLPASVTTLVVVSILSWGLLPPFLWKDTAHQLLGSLFYVQNWVLTSQAVDYLGRHNAPTAVQHYWSLSIEEQFYVAVPIAFVLIWFGLRKRRVETRLTVTGIVLFLLLVGSFALSISQSSTSGGIAYFSTAVRAWEFLAGVVLAYVIQRTSRKQHRFDHSRARIVAASVGWILIGVGVGASGGNLPFPGWVASISVLGSLAVIAAGSVNVARIAVYEVRPLQWTGAISYSLYLWHWPVIVFFPYLLPEVVSGIASVLMVAGSFALAAASHRYVERSFWNPLGPTTRSSALLPTIAGATIVTCVIAGVQLVTVDSMLSAQRSELVSYIKTSSECVGAEAVLSNDCSAQTRPNPLHTIELAKADTGPVWNPSLWGGACEKKVTFSAAEEYSCSFGDPESDNLIVVAGDSHAAQWAQGVLAAVDLKDTQVVVYHRGACPILDVKLLPDHGSGLGTECVSWMQQTVESIQKNPKVDIVVTSMRAFAYLPATGVSPRAAAESRLADSYRSTLSSLANAERTVVAIRDTPYAGIDIPTCLAEHADDRLVCSFSEKKKYRDDVTDLAVRRASDPNVRYLDFSNVFCSKGTCAPLIGGVIAYVDHNHITGTLSSTFAPWLTLSLRP